MGIGIILMKPLLNKYDVFWIINLRLVAGVFSSMLLFSFLKNKGKILTAIISSNQKGMILISFVLSAYISSLFWVLGFKYLNTSLSAVLNQTTTIFTILLAAVFLKERLNKATLVATAVAITGVLIISISN